VDVAISNGVINLSPEKEHVFAELYRVLRPGGRVQFADIVIEAELSAAARNDIELWVG
jgi:arsenite methyltransferase